MSSGIKKTYLYQQLVSAYNKFNNLRKKIYNNFFPTAYILLYHRIDKVKKDPHLLCVNQENFYRQLKYLKSNYNIVSLKTLVDKLKSRKISKKTVSVTFDDGYADNLYNALPIIKELSIPVTIFITVGKIDSRTPFYWDEKTKIEDRGRPLTIEELIMLSKNKEVEIESHSLTHPRLSQVSIGDQKKEIIESKRLLEKIIKEPIDGFSYPFGSTRDFTEETIGLVMKAKYSYACINFPARVNNNSSIYKLPRFLVRNWTLKEFKQNFANFL